VGVFGVAFFLGAGMRAFLPHFQRTDWAVYFGVAFLPWDRHASSFSTLPVCLYRSLMCAPVCSSAPVCLCSLLSNTVLGYLPGQCRQKVTLFDFNCMLSLPTGPPLPILSSMGGSLPAYLPSSQSGMPPHWQLLSEGATTRSQVHT